jgi:hypothetical protein
MKQCVVCMLTSRPNPAGLPVLHSEPERGGDIEGFRRTFSILVPDSGLLPPSRIVSVSKSWPTMHPRTYRSPLNMRPCTYLTIYNALGGSVAWALRCAYRHTEMVIRRIWPEWTRIGLLAIGFLSLRASTSYSRPRTWLLQDDIGRNVNHVAPRVDNSRPLAFFNSSTKRYAYKISLLPPGFDFKKSTFPDFNICGFLFVCFGTPIIQSIKINKFLTPFDHGFY